jgi:phosphonoacetate hydrolase
MDRMAAVELNGRRYQAPRRSTVVICVDGCDPDYIEHGLAAGTIPTIARFRDTGFLGYADAVMPTFTNPNNVSIVTGAPPRVHGVCGNYYLDRSTGAEIMVTDAALLRSETVLGLLSRQGVATVAITAKDKLRKALGHGMVGPCFSSEAADRCTLAEHGIERVEALVGRARPEVYSADLSLFVLDAGIRLLERDGPALMYLSLSDYVQHTHAPGTPAADDFYREIDRRIARLVDLGAVVAITADHGISDKSLPDGAPAVIYVEDRLAERFGAGVVRVICPSAITAPSDRSCAATPPIQHDCPRLLISAAGSKG